MRKFTILSLIVLLSISTVGCKEDTSQFTMSKNTRSISLDNLNYTKEQFEKEYINYLFFIQQSLQEISGGDNSVVVYHKTYKINKSFTKDNLVSTETITQAERYLESMQVNDLKYLLSTYISFIKEIQEDFVYAANNPNVTEDNVIQINKDIINKLQTKINELSKEEYDMVYPTLEYFVLGDVSSKVDYALSCNQEFVKQNTLKKLKLVANENIATQLLNTIYE